MKKYIVKSMISGVLYSIMTNFTYKEGEIFYVEMTPLDTLEASIPTAIISFIVINENA